MIALALAALVQTPYARDYRLEAPPERRDSGFFHSAPDSLCLDADAGEAYYRFPDVAVKGGQVYRLRLRYLVARGSEGTASARLCFYRDLPDSWRSVGGKEVELPVVGRWARVDVLVKTPAEANSANLDVRLGDSDFGLAWIDDCSLAPRGEPVTRGP